MLVSVTQAAAAFPQGAQRQAVRRGNLLLVRKIAIVLRKRDDAPSHYERHADRHRCALHLHTRAHRPVSVSRNARYFGESPEGLPASEFPGPPTICSVGIRSSIEGSGGNGSCGSA